ncbi:hypothetical protein HMPREF0262_03088 [Clostridium sp. ATCC 29733]|nr:hypothetical protein HMPREF0262_03088 [Clostridium sp. ATCC 29733]
MGPALAPTAAGGSDGAKGKRQKKRGERSSPPFYMGPPAIAMAAEKPLPF